MYMYAQGIDSFKANRSRRFQSCFVFCLFFSQCDSAKAAKIHLALQKLEQASIRRLFVKAFTADGASKSLLVDETMTCGHVTRLLADKNHVQMEPIWALVEHLPDLQMGMPKDIVIFELIFIY